MKNTSKESPTQGSILLQRRFSWLVLLTFAATAFVLVTDSYDSTILKAPALVVGSALLVVLLVFQWKDRPVLQFTWVHISFLGLLLAGAVSLVGAARVTSGLWALLTLSCLFLLFAASSASFRDPKNELLLHTGLVCICLVTSLVGSVQAFITSPSILFLTSGDQVVMSSLGNTSYYGGFLVLMFPVLLGIGIANRHRSALGPMCFTLLLVMLFLLVKTESRSSWLALFIAVPLFFLVAARASGKGWLYAGAALAVLVVLGLLFPDIVQRRISALFASSGTSSFDRRIYFYGGAWRAFLSSPVIGNGLGNFLLFLPKFRSPDYWIARSEDIVPHAHNEYLELLSETGILGFLAFCAVLFFFIRYMRRALPESAGPGRFILAGYCAGLAAVLIDNLASMNLRTIPVAAGFWIIAGAAMGHLRSPAILLRWKIPPRLALLRFAMLVALLGAAPFYAMQISSRYAAEKVFMEGLMLRFAGKTQAASEKFEATIADNPLHQEANLYLLSNLIEKADYHRASDVSGRLLQDYPFAPKAHLLRAVALFELGEKEKASEEMKRELAIARYPQSYYYAAVFAGGQGDTNAERGYLFTQLDACIRNGRTDYLREGIGKISDVCSSGGRDSCMGILRAAGGAFPREPEVLKAVMKEYLELGASDQARSLGTSSVLAGVLRKEECEAILNGTAGGG